RGTVAPARPGARAKLKLIQRRLIFEEARERFLRARAAQRGGPSEVRAERAREEGFAPGEKAARARTARSSQRIDGFRTLQALAPNVMANNRSTDVVTCPGPVPCSTQSEEMIAAWHQYVMIAWNDGEHADPFTNPPPNNDVLGCAVSTDSGATWNDKG